MTLIVTAGCPHFVLQVSDRRFTDERTSKIVTDEGNKAAVVRASDADFAVSFTGLASAWLIKRISEAKAAKKGFDACVEAVRSAAGIAFGHIARKRGRSYPHTFVFAGFHHEATRPRVVFVTNCESDDFRLTDPMLTFVTRPIFGSYPYRVNGYTIAMPQDSKAKIKGLIRKSHAYPATTDLLVQEIRRAANHKKHGRYIGEQCMSVCVFRSGNVDAVYHPTHSRPIIYAPNLIEVVQRQEIVIMGAKMGGGLHSMSLGTKEVSVHDRRMLSAEDTLMLIKRGVALGEHGHHQKALQAFDRSIELDANSSDALYNRALALAHLGRHAETLTTLDRLVGVHPDHYNAHSNRGSILLKLQRYKEALGAFDRALRLRADDPNAHNNRGGALHHLGRHEEALAAYDRSLELRPDDPTTLYNRGTALNLQGKYELALDAFDHSLKLRPDDPDTVNNRGIAVGSLGRYEEALTAFNRALELRPDHPDSLIGRGTTLSHQGCYDEALADLSRALELAPDDADTLNNRGITLSHQGSYEEALADYNRSLELRRDHPSTFYNRACMYSRWEKPAEAFEDLRRAVEGDPKSRDKARTDSDFDNIRSDPRFRELVGGG